MPENTEPYDSTVFHESWWLDATTDGQWRLLEAEGRGESVARLPILTVRSLGRWIIRMPPLTRTLGPVIAGTAPGGALPQRARYRLLEELIAKLPPGLPIELTFDPSVKDLYPFVEAGFQVEVAYTFRLPYGPDEKALWRGFRDYTRNIIRRAGDTFDVEKSRDVDRFVSLYEDNIRRTGHRMRPDAARMRKIVRACIENDRGQAFFTRDASGADVGGIFLIWDSHWCYFLLSTRDKERSGKGGNSLLTWKALQWSREQGLGFDFDGPSRFVLQFGAEAVPRWKVSRMDPARRAAKVLWAARPFLIG